MRINVAIKLQVSISLLLKNVDGMPTDQVYIRIFMWIAFVFLCRDLESSLASIFIFVA